MRALTVKVVCDAFDAAHSGAEFAKAAGAQLLLTELLQLAIRLQPLRKTASCKL